MEHKKSVIHAPDSSNNVRWKWATGPVLSLKAAKVGICSCFAFSFLKAPSGLQRVCITCDRGHKKEVLVERSVEENFGEIYRRVTNSLWLFDVAPEDTHLGDREAGGPI